LQRRLAASETVVVVDVRQHEEFTARPGRNRRAASTRARPRIGGRGPQGLYGPPGYRPPWRASTLFLLGGARQIISGLFDLSGCLWSPCWSRDFEVSSME
jgi:hypothetical protein